MSINTIFENMISISIAFSSFPIYMLCNTHIHTRAKKKKNQGFSRQKYMHIRTNKRETNVKRRFYNFHVTIRKERCVKKITSVTGEKRRTSVCKNEYGAPMVNGQHYQERREREASNSGPLSVIRLCPQIAKLCTLETIAA